MTNLVSHDTTSAFIPLDPMLRLLLFRSVLKHKPCIPFIKTHFLNGFSISWKTFANDRPPLKGGKKFGNVNLFFTILDIQGLEISILGARYEEADRIYDNLITKDDKIFQLMIKRCKYEVGPV